MPPRANKPNPDGAIAGADRLHAAYIYRGIAVGAPTGGTIMAMERSRQRRVFGRVFGRVN